SSRLDCAGSSRGSARSVASNEIPTLSAVRPGPVRSVDAVTTASSPETAPANDCSNSVGVGLGSGDWLEDDESSESNHEHPDRTRASATTPPWILLLRFTPITLPCPRGINTFHSPFRDASRPNPRPPRHPTRGHGIVVLEITPPEPTREEDPPCPKAAPDPPSPPFAGRSASRWRWAWAGSSTPRHCRSWSQPSTGARRPARGSRR